MSPVRLLAILAAIVAAVAGCNGTDYAINRIDGLSARPGGGVTACAAYSHETPRFAESPSIDYRHRTIDVDADGDVHDRGTSCMATATKLDGLRLSDGGKLAMDVDNLSRYDAAGALVWAVPTPFATLDTVSDEAGGRVYLGRGPQVAPLDLADGNIAWIAELR